MKNRILTQEELVRILEGNTPCLVLEGEGGCSLVFMERGGRLIGAFPKEGGKNTLWTHPKLETILQGEQWNVGGERLWISPEREFFYRDPEGFNSWFCPKELDPGNFRFISRGWDQVSFRNDVDLLNVRTGDSYHDVSLMRSMSSLPNPYLSDPRLGEIWDRVSYVGMQSIDEVVVPGIHEHLAISPWTLTQVNPGPPRHPGTALVPTRGADAKPIHYFNLIPRDRLRIGEDHISFKIDGEAIHKLGIKPEDLDPTRQVMIAYTAEVEKNESLLIIKRSCSVPRSQSECLDVPKRDPADLRAVVQSYNSGPEDENSAYLGFGEVEIQLSPLQRQGQGHRQRTSAELLIFTGRREDILKLAEVALNVGKPNLFT